MMLPLLVSRHPGATAGAAAGMVSVIALGVWAVVRRRPTAEELEQRRRVRLAAAGRIVDGSLTGAEPDEQAPQVILYRYRIAGVTYDCGQDVSAIEPPVRGLRLNFPVQVRYDRANPGDSIVVAEGWNGLWSTGFEHDSGTRSVAQ